MKKILMLLATLSFLSLSNLALAQESMLGTSREYQSTSRPRPDRNTAAANENEESDHMSMGHMKYMMDQCMKNHNNMDLCHEKMTKNGKKSEN